MYERHHLMGKDFFRSKDLPIRILHRDPQPDYPIHTHDFSEMVLVLKGQGTHFTRKSSFTVEAGDLFIINGDRAHGYRDLENLVLINILFDMKSLALPPMDMGRSPGFHTLFTVEPVLRSDTPFASRLRLNPLQIEEVRGMIRGMEEELEGKREGYRFLTAAYFMQLITRLSRLYSDNREEEGRDFYRMGEAISFIEHNLDRNITVKELLEVCALSESTLQRAFRKITGTSVLNYHLRKRIDRACSLLADTDYTVTRIAYDTGFGDSNYFSRQFRRIKGEAPRDFRKRVRGE